MKKFVLTIGMAFMLSGIISAATAPAVFAVSDDPAQYDNADPMMEEATDEAEAYIEQESDMPQEGDMIEEEDADASEGSTFETDEESYIEETEETEVTE